MTEPKPCTLRAGLWLWVMSLTPWVDFEKKIVRNWKESKHLQKSKKGALRKWLGQHQLRVWVYCFFACGSHGFFLGWSYPSRASPSFGHCHCKSCQGVVLVRAHSWRERLKCSLVLTLTLTYGEGAHVCCVTRVTVRGHLTVLSFHRWVLGVNLRPPGPGSGFNWVVLPAQDPKPDRRTLFSFLNLRV